MIQFLTKYFPKLNEYNWVKIPFSISLKYDHIPHAAKQQFIKIREDSTLEKGFNEIELTEF